METTPTVSALSTRTQLTFSYLIKNLMSLMGIAGMAFFGLFLLLMIGLDFFGISKEENIYSGIVTFMILPLLFCASAVFTLIGMMWKWRRTRKNGVEISIIPGRTRKAQIFAVSAALLVTTLWLSTACFATYKSYQVTDSTTFCGMACHQVMEPEYTAYQHSPHAHVNCVECHIGPGAEHFVEAKFRGMGQVWQTVTHKYKTPIKTPVANLRKASETCGSCHSSDRTFRSVEKVFTHFGIDDDNTPVRFNLLLKVGSGNSDPEAGAHWHTNEGMEIKYLPLDDKFQKIPYVRVSYKDGRVEEFVTSAFDRTALADDKLRSMDCLDCHSRPAHIFNSPARALDIAMDKGLISSALPGIKKAALNAVKGEYKTKEEAFAAIDTALDRLIKEKKLAVGQDQLMTQARQNIKDIYSANFFPQQGVDYRGFINNMGHFEYAGCERCHDGKHVSTTSKALITQKCDSCHIIVSQSTVKDEGKGPQYKVASFEHPEEPVNMKKTCSSCHALKKE